MSSEPRNDLVRVPGTCRSCGAGVLTPISPVMMELLFRDEHEALRVLANRMQRALNALESLKTLAPTPELAGLIGEIQEGMAHESR